MIDGQSRIKFRFIHASDIHLGSIIHASVKENNKIDEMLKEAVYNSFRRICTSAIEFNADFIILSGDIYDREFSTVKGSRVLYDESIRLKKENIHIYLIRGNHDPLGGEAREIFTLPSNVHIFDCDKAQSFNISKNGKIIAKVIGQSYKSRWEKRKIALSYEVEDSSVYNIGVLHTALEPVSSKYVPCSIEELKKIENIHYWALGHIHKCRILNSKPVIVYSGIPQGRDIGEEGIGGCLLVEVMEDLSQQIKFIPISSVIWKRAVLNINDSDKVLMGLNDMEELLIEKGEEILNAHVEAPENLESVYPIEKVLKGYIVHWSIEGRGQIDELLREDEENAEKYLVERMNKHFLNERLFLYTNAVSINTSKEIPDIDYLIKNNRIIREVNDISRLCLEDELIKKEIINTFGNVFEKKSSLEDMDEEKIQLNNDLVEEIINSAKELIIEKFLEKGE
ncbi:MULTISPECIES: metallophosphoesterase family protein [Clostridium]|uniref:Putative metallophosphoesterase YhaO n=2 Tax=Clostridium TaxID=1485 RepID=A0A151ARZ4_9CLOT|nr:MULTISPECIES: DNA repair exonuclease [Clostridium]KYH30350.1 putative metallophosphoesterase YhaO [Clostridium colicanis DSM 13634]MBE6044429.1 DNA repair exonuclease [Clostridium thermopalmarium]PRR69463.1 putative metallophosphoesterase YhaO [Clostridium thermopalmarium DSM 5974]PVZ26271.1 DNA repair exonuclease SbcCD nuclease subunit [Clostridium thermopalmarium DSM 5974]